jgi:ABC-type phosphate transport system substrate-binding protein
MSFNYKSGYGLGHSIATTVALGLVLGSLATTAQAQIPRPTISGAPGATPPGNSYSNCNATTLAFYPLEQRICSNGAGATFPFPLFAGGVTSSTPPGAFFTYGPGLFNYASRGSGTGITSFITNTAPAGNGVNSPAGVSPLSFASTDSPLTQAQINSYLAQRVNNGAGFGPIVELPITSGSVTVMYNNGGSGTAPTPAQTITLTRTQECTIFNGGSVTVTKPTGGVVTLNQGVRRADASGTTFITTNHLNTVCSSLGLWSYTNSAGNQVSRGFGQVSLPDRSIPARSIDGSICQSLTAPRSNTVCWPSAFFTGSGNPGVANVIANSVSGAAGTAPGTPPTPIAGGGASGVFGYVEFATAAALNAVPGSAAPVDTDLVTANNPSARAFANTDIARLTNVSGTVVDATAPNISDALLTATDASPCVCRIVYNLPDPTQGYPIVGVNYLLFYGDYTPDNETIFSGQGNALAARYQSFVLNTVSDTALADTFGYSALPPAVQGDVIDTAFNCIQSVPFPGTNPLDAQCPSVLKSAASLDVAKVSMRQE